MKMPSLPDSKGHFGVFGGRYVAETIMPALTELEAAYRESRTESFSGGVPLLSEGLFGKGNAAVSCRQPHGKIRRGQDISEA